MLIKIVHSGTSRTRHMAGVSLIESLVALVLLALGVLGLLGIQLKTMTDNQTANHRTTAARLAEELFERAKTNPANVVDPAAPLGAASWVWMNQYASAWNAAVPANQNCTVTGNLCDFTQRAAQDRRDWLLSVRSSLPGGEAMITASPNTRQLVAIIGWQAKSASTGNANQDAALAAPFVINLAGVATPAACGTTHSCYAAYGQP